MKKCHTYIRKSDIGKEETAIMAYKNVNCTMIQHLARLVLRVIENIFFVNQSKK